MPNDHLRAGYRALLVLLACLAWPAWAGDTMQTMTLGKPAPYSFFTYANARLDTRLPVQHAVIVLHGVHRDADHYYRSGLTLLGNAGLTQDDTLLLAPRFFSEDDPQKTPTPPLWVKSQWLQGQESVAGRSGISAFAVLDDLLAYLADRHRFPHLQDITLIGHSAGGQLLQRYTLLGTGDQALRALGIHVRYIVASPSTYLYLDANRPLGEGFAPLPAAQCADYDRYRYGLPGAPDYFVTQHLDARQVLGRYAARDVTYLVGERDRHPHSQIMDRSCAAQAQGSDRVERQLNYLRYEAFLAQRWSITLAHRQYVLPGIGHDPARLLTDPGVAKLLFPGH